MGQKTKKSPTPSTAKKIGAELPKVSPKGTPSSLPPAAIARLEEVRPARGEGGLEEELTELQRRSLAFQVACSRALSRDEAYGEGEHARVEHRFVCLTCGLVTDFEHDDCHARAERFAGAPTLSAVAEIARTTDQEPEDVVRTLLELGLRVLGRSDRNAYFDGRRLWETLTYGSEA